MPIVCMIVKDTVLHRYPIGTTGIVRDLNDHNFIPLYSRNLGTWVVPEDRMAVKDAKSVKGNKIKALLRKARY